MPLLQVLGVTPRLPCYQCPGQVLQGKYRFSSLFYGSVGSLMEVQLAPEFESFIFYFFRVTAWSLAGTCLIQRLLLTSERQAKFRTQTQQFHC